MTENNQPTGQTERRTPRRVREESLLSRRARSLNVRLAPGRMIMPPQVIVLGVNNVCNLHCHMCDVGTGFEGSNFFANLMASRPLNMPLELLESVLEQTAAWSPQALIGFAFTEPLIYPHLEAGVARATALGLSTTVTTNGLTLPKKAAALASAGLTEINLSIDGPAAIHNEIRGNPRSFERAMEGIDRLLEAPAEERPAISMYCTITDRNFDRLTELVEAVAHLPLQRLGFLHTNFTPPDVARSHNAQFGERYPATESNMSEVCLEDIDLSVLSSQLESATSAGAQFPVVVSPHAIDEASLERFYRRPAELWGRRCNDAFRAVMIKSNGDVIPAHGRCYNVPWGNLHSMSLRAIWNSAEAGRFRKTLTGAGGLLPGCSRCCSAF